MEKLTQEYIHEIAAKDDLHIAPFRADGKTYGTPTWIWNVEVGGKLYVRAYYGKQSRWHKSAMTQKSGKIEAIGKTFEVGFQSVEDSDLNEKIDAAYSKKYAESPYLAAMSKAKVATVEVTPI